MNLSNKEWWSYLPTDVQNLFENTEYLLAYVKKADHKFSDYSFVLFSASKAYEGFLKKLFLDLGFITEADFSGIHFRIGKSLNPQLDIRLRGDNWVYEKLVHFCQGEALPEKLWKTWKECRNEVFHWFPQNAGKKFSLKEAQEKYELIVDAIDEAFKKCKINK